MAPISSTRCHDSTMPTKKWYQRCDEDLPSLVQCISIEVLECRKSFDSTHHLRVLKREGLMSTLATRNAGTETKGNKGQLLRVR